LDWLSKYFLIKIITKQLGQASKIFRTYVNYAIPGKFSVSTAPKTLYHTQSTADPFQLLPCTV